MCCISFILRRALSRCALCFARQGSQVLKDELMSIAFLHVPHILKLNLSVAGCNTRSMAIRRWIVLGVLSLTKNCGAGGPCHGFEAHTRDVTYSRPWPCVDDPIHLTRTPAWFSSCLLPLVFSRYIISRRTLILLNGQVPLQAWKIRGFFVTSFLGECIHAYVWYEQLIQVLNPSRNLIITEYVDREYGEGYNGDGDSFINYKCEN